MRLRDLAIAVALALAPAAFPEKARADTADAVAGERERLLVAVQANNHPLSEGVDAIQTPEGKLYLPLGEIARLLELGISVNPDGTTAQGRGNASSVMIDVGARSMTTSRGSRVLDSAALVSEGGEIFVRTDILEELLGVTLHPDFEALSVTITSKDQLPFELALERKEKREQLNGASSAPENPGPIKGARYELISPPAFDVRADFGASHSGGTGRAELRAGGDFLFVGYQLFLGTDSRFRPRNLRLTVDRRDFDGGMFGPLDLTRIAAGDVFTPSLPVGPRSFNGRGIFLSSEPLQRISIFDKLDLRGELPAGWDVELYVNEALSGAQEASASGRYEFLNVPLVYGRNVIRLRFYGPLGEHREEIRRFNVDGGQLRKGEFVYNFGAIADGHPLIDIARNPLTSVIGNEGFAFAANARYGLTRWLTLTAGLSSYRPIDERITVATVGARADLGAYAVQLDGALDQHHGGAIAAAIAGPLLGGSIIARHAEYAGNFIDQTASGGGLRPLKRSTDVRANALVHLGKVAAPISLILDHDVLSDGTPLLSAQLVTTLGWNNKRVSVGLGYNRTSGNSPARLTALTDVYLVAAGGWQIRAGTTTRITPELGLDALQLSVDRAIGDNKLLRLGATRAFSGSSSTTVDGSLLVRTRRLDLSLNGSYNLGAKDFRIGAQISFGLLYDIFRHRYALTKPGAATTGALALSAFNDLNGDGLRQERESGIDGLTMLTGAASATTDKNGYALASAIGNGLIPVRISGEQSGDPLAAAEDMKFQAAARPGRTIRVDYPIALVSEVQIRAVISGAADRAKAQGVSALRLVLVSSSGKTFTQTTAYDGVADFANLPAGEYRLEIDKDQAGHLGAKLVASVLVVAPPEGGVLPSVDVQVTFETWGDAP